MVPLRRRPDGARRECLPHRYAIAATALNSTLLLCRRPVVLTLLLRSPAFCSALSADFAVFGSLLPVHGHLHAAPYIVFSRAASLCYFAKFRRDETIYKLKLARSPHSLPAIPGKTTSYPTR